MHQLLGRQDIHRGNPEIMANILIPRTSDDVRMPDWVLLVLVDVGIQTVDVRVFDIFSLDGIGLGVECGRT